MKILLLTTALSIGIAAKAGTFGNTGTTICKGNLNGSPIQISVQWGQVKEKLGNLPPYNINQEQLAIVHTKFYGQVFSEYTTFNQSGGTTRCDWWKSSKTNIFLKQIQPVLELQFYSSNKISPGCGVNPSGAYLTNLTLKNQSKKIELQCNHLNGNIH